MHINIHTISFTHSIFFTWHFSADISICKRPGGGGGCCWPKNTGPWGGVGGNSVVGGGGRGDCCCCWCCCCWCCCCCCCGGGGGSGGNTGGIGVSMTGFGNGFWIMCSAFSWIWPTLFRWPTGCGESFIGWWWWWWWWWCNFGLRGPRSCCTAVRIIHNIASL